MLSVVGQLAHGSVGLVAVPIPRKICLHGTTNGITRALCVAVFISLRTFKMTINANAIGVQYKPFFDNWDAKVLGPRPSAEMLTKVHGLGLRHGKQALACAMSLRADGVTGSQIVIACGAPQLNRMRGLIAEGVFKRLPASNNGQHHTVYKCEVTPKGEAEIKRLEKVAENSAASTKPKAEKPKAKAKAPKVKAKPVKASRKANAKPAKVDSKIEPVAEPATAPEEQAPQSAS